MEETQVHFHLADLEAQRRAGSDPWLEFLRVPSLRAGLYVLPAGGVDLQTPHAEDEIYVILSGRGRFTADGEDRAVSAHDVLFVAKGIEHRFHAIEEDLSIAVVFAR